MKYLSRIPLLAQESLHDFRHSSYPVLSNQDHIRAGIEWLCRAQDKSGDGGVSAWFSLINGWQPSYIETTGYIINTFLDAAEYLKRQDLKDRAIQMADFLTEMQLKSGGYRTVVPSRGLVSPPTVFNSGQDLIGLCDIYTLTKDKRYLRSVEACADFLLSIQEEDGSWLKFTYGSMKHTYHTRVAWGILKVWEISHKEKYLIAAKKNLEWAAKQQQSNGWFKQNQLPSPNPTIPYTHTIAYAIEGFLWSGLLLKDAKYLQIAIKGALPLAKYYLISGFLPGTFDKNWKSEDHYTCLTGDAQLSLVWLELYRYTQNKIFLKAAQKMIYFLKTTQPTETSQAENIKGGIKGSSPIYGDLLKNRGYCRFAYLNWPTKFFIDALLVSEKLQI